MEHTLNQVKPLKRYTLGEEIFNSVSHGVGALLGIIGTVVLIVLSAVNGSALALGTSIVYGLSLIMLYTMSTLYHAIASEKAKENPMRNYMIIKNCIKRAVG